MILVGIVPSVVYTTAIDLIVLFIYLALIIHVVCMLFISPAKNKLLPRIVGLPRIVRVNGYISSTSQTASLIGESISGFIIGAIGFTGVMLFHSGIYLLASILLMLVINISLPPEVEPKEKVLVPKKDSMWHELKEGFSVLKRNRPIFKLIVLVATQYGANAVQFGLLHAAAAVGGIIKVS